jgi:protein-S-isoprenylcysteine O-methyltransferase Ste14
MNLDRRKLQDLTFAAPLIAFYSWTIYRNAPVLPDLYNEAFGPQGSDYGIARLFSVFAGVCFGALLVGILVFRMPPARSIHGVLPRVLAVVGTFAALAFPYLPPSPNGTAAILGMVLLCAGTVLTMYAIVYLGRSFSIVPEARKLVTSGPYRFVRHPVYLFEEIAVFGISIQFAAPTSTLLFLVHGAIQFARLHYEEQVLRENFPEYEAYAMRTARLVPGVY